MGNPPSKIKNLPSVAELSPPENDKSEAKTDQEEMLETRQSMIDNLREDINSKAYKSVIPPSKSVIKMINRFYRKLEESVWRMSTLGCIEEDENSEHDETLSEDDTVRMYDMKKVKMNNH